ncbi:hypothetical protein T484DRAFT_1933992 [Baffinella frigidus]|nr:hypothetical protein T484DRAFT_1933992 [Cryptophyta sp. CCMP2293]
MRARSFLLFRIWAGMKRAVLCVLRVERRSSAFFAKTSAPLPHQNARGTYLKPRCDLWVVTFHSSSAFIAKTSAPLV